MQKKVALYARVASLDANAVEEQHEGIENFVQQELKCYWPYRCGRYSDMGYSGVQQYRPGLNRIVIDIEQGKIDKLVVTEMDRIFSCESKLVQFIDYLHREQVSLHVIKDDVRLHYPRSHLCRRHSAPPDNSFFA